MIKKTAVLLAVLLSMSLTSCYNDIDDNLNVDNTNQFVAADGTVYYTGLLDCDNGNYSVNANNLLDNVVIPNNLPETMDLSPFLPPIGDQGRQGSCTSWATTYYLKSFQERIQSGVAYNPARIMSPAYTYNQLTQGACGGTTFESTLDILREQGAVSIAEFPYFDTSCSTQPTAFQNNLATPNKIANYKYLSGNNMVLEMKTLLQQQTPILISTYLTKQFGKIDSFGLAAYRVHSIDPNEKGGCHAMLVIGYSDTYNAFKVVNSWGENWGTNGFVWIDYQAFDDVLNPNTTFKVINQALVVEDL